MYKKWGGKWNMCCMNEKLTWSMYKESCNINARGLPLNERNNAR